MVNNGIKRYSLSKQVSDQLEQMIESGKYAVGDKIPPETELMAYFNVSRNTLREAIRSLASAGVLDVKQGDGTYVSSNNRFNANMNREFATVSYDEIQEARNALELTIVYLASQRRTQEDIDLMALTLENRRTLRETVKEDTRADIEFHLSIARASHNKILFDLYSSLSSYMEDHISERTATTNLNHEQIDALHEELFKAISQGDPHTAIASTHNILNI